MTVTLQQLEYRLWDAANALSNEIHRRVGNVEATRVSNTTHEIDRIASEGKSL